MYPAGLSMFFLRTWQGLDRMDAARSIKSTVLVLLMYLFFKPSIPIILFRCNKIPFAHEVLAVMCVLTRATFKPL